MHLAVKGRSGRFRIVNDWQFKDSRSLRVTRSFKDWPLEDQVLLARKLKLCPRVVRAANGRLRVCGNDLKPRDDSCRTVGGKCKIDQPPIPELDGPPLVHPTALWQQEGSYHVLVPEDAVGGDGELSDCQPEVPTLSACTQTTTVHIKSEVPTLTICPQTTVHIEPKMMFICDHIWDATFAQQTRDNNRSNLRIILRYLGFEPSDGKKDVLASVDRDVFLAKASDTKELFDLIWTKKAKSQHTMLATIRRVLDRLGKTEAAALLLELEKNKKLDIGPQPMDAKRRAVVEKVAAKLGVDLTRDRPGELLLECIQHKILAFVAENPEWRAFSFAQLLGFWLPGARAGSMRFRWSRNVPNTEQQWKDAKNNLVVLEDGRPVGLFFGNLKMTTSARYLKCWKKRFFVDEAGVHTMDMGTQVPCHMKDIWRDWFERVLALCTEQVPLTGCGRMGSFVFKCKREPIDLSEEFWGVRFGSYMQRIIFRNGIRETDDFFIKKVMNHNHQADADSYVKAELMDGPWSTDPVA